MFSTILEAKGVAFRHTNLDRFPRSGIIMGSVATFRHNRWIGTTFCTLWLCTETALALSLLSTGHLQTAVDIPRLEDQ
uniref:Uncharacterized protein n=1 Tax=Solanum tuberosum TaxID=4113 RepID=M1DIT0_SOLTU